ncbi:hypothetical protein ABBQ32_003960 [Trebouxia sp. C0010 RCD-2024]
MQHKHPSWSLATWPAQAGGQQDQQAMTNRPALQKALLSELIMCCFNWKNIATNNSFGFLRKGSSEQPTAVAQGCSAPVAIQPARNKRSWTSGSTCTHGIYRGSLSLGRPPALL